MSLTTRIGFLCCRVLQGVVGCCSVWQSVAVSCTVLQCVAMPCRGDLDEPAVASTLEFSICVAVYCRVLYGVHVYGRMLQGVVGCCRVL